MLAVESFRLAGALDGEQVREPLSDRQAWWITGEEIERAKSLGFQLIEPQQVITNHLAASFTATRKNCSPGSRSTP